MYSVKNNDWMDLIKQLTDKGIPHKASERHMMMITNRCCDDAPDS